MVKFLDVYITFNNILSRKTFLKYAILICNDTFEGKATRYGNGAGRLSRKTFGIGFCGIYLAILLDFDLERECSREHILLMSGTVAWNKGKRGVQ